MPLAHAELPAAGKVDSTNPSLQLGTRLHTSTQTFDALSDEWRQWESMVRKGVGRPSIVYTPVCHVARVQSPCSVVFRTPRAQLSRSCLFPGRAQDVTDSVIELLSPIAQ